MSLPIFFFASFDSSTRGWSGGIRRTGVAVPKRAT